MVKAIIEIEGDNEELIQEAYYLMSCRVSEMAITLSISYKKLDGILK